jgi:hypothetical protein
MSLERSMLDWFMVLELLVLPDRFMFIEPDRSVEGDWFVLPACVPDDVPGLSTGPRAAGVSVELLIVEAFGGLDCAKAVPAVRRAMAAT